MKKIALPGSVLLVIVALISFARTPQATGQASALVTVLNPAMANKLAERIPLAPRLDALEGKTVYLVDMQWGGPEAAYSVYEEMQGWFARNMPSVKTEIRRTAGGPFGDDAGLRKEIAEKHVDAVIIGIAG